MSRPHLLIVSKDQFGYLTDTYQYCTHLKSLYDLTYLCWDYQREMITEDGVRVFYVSRKGPKIQRLARYVIAILREMRRSRYDIVFVVYFRLCSLLRILSWKERMVLDIRTGYDGESSIKGFISNSYLLAESVVFSNITIISESLRKELRIRPDKCHILPLGAIKYVVAEKSFDRLRLLYVGTFDYRHIDRTIAGFTMFNDELGNRIPLSYDLVGFGLPEEVEAIKEAIGKSACRELIHFHGRVPHTQVSSFLETCNIGIAFIPITRQYDCQPSTKVFEYLLSGMPVVATDTRENRSVINQSNGVLVQDTAEAFCEGLRAVFESRATYNSGTIKQNSEKHTWPRIIHGNLDPFLRSLLQSDENHQRSRMFSDAVVR